MILKQRPFALVLGALLVVVLAAAAVLAWNASGAVGAQDRDYDPTTDGPLPPAEVEDAPAVPIPAAQEAVLVDEFANQPDDWTREQRTIFPTDFGIWESEAGKLVQAGAEGGIALEESILLAPASVGNPALVATQVYPQGNQVVGLIFGFQEDQGYYAFRVFRADASGNSEQSNNYLLEYYDLATEEYRVIAEETGPGFEPGRWQELRVFIEGNRIVCSFDGQQVLDITDEQPVTSGQVGVTTLALGEILFDNFTVAQPR